MRFIFFFILLSLSSISLGNETNPNEEENFYLIQRKDGSFSFLNKSKGVFDLELQERWLRPKGNGKIPNGLAVYANITYQILFEGNNDYEGILDIIEENTGLRPIEGMADNCYWLVKASCLDTLLPLAKTDKTKAKIHSYIGLISKDPHTSAKNFKEALRLDSENSDIQYHAELYSLSVAITLLDTYQRELFDATILKRLCINPKDDFKSFWSNAGNRLYYGIFNTWNMWKLCLYQDDYQKDWNNQVERLTDLTSMARFLFFYMTHMKKVPLKEIEKLIKTDKEVEKHFTDYFKVKGRSLDFLKSSFYRSTYYQHIGLKDQLPNLEELGFEKGEYDFVEVGIGDVLQGEINIFNVALFFVIPPITSAIGKTQTFVRFANWARIAPAIEKIRGMGKWGGLIAVAIPHLFDGAEIVVAVKVCYKVFYGGSDWDQFDIDFRALNEEEKVFMKVQEV